jgi:glycosyltransferase involved in cell wall biosynthesis
MLITYAVMVCDEYKELNTLLHFLKRVVTNGEVIVLVDSSKKCPERDSVLKKFPDYTVHYRDFDGDFSSHRNFLCDQASGEYIFMLDADEVPTETLMDKLDEVTRQGADIIYIPRINICLGQTREWLKSHDFTTNEVGWINWPDYQGRIVKSHIRWQGKVHEKPEGSDKRMVINAEPWFALLHVKTVEKQDKQNILYKDLT